MNRLFPLFAFAGLLFIEACSNNNEKSDTKTDEASKTEIKTDSGFTASPQPVEEQEISTLSIGAKAPDFNLPGVDGKFHSLSDYDDAEVLLIVFTCNHCPTAQAYEERLKSVAEDYKDKVATVAISPNSPLALLYGELGYSDMGDTFEEMKIRAKDKNYNFPYLYDGDTHRASIEYGPIATPHAFVFDRERKLRYKGRLDASEKPGTANAEDLRNALDAVLAGEEVENPVTKTFGCSIKWAWKDDWKEKIYSEWEDAPVTLEEIDIAGVKALLQNDSDKLRLINVWATWCGPCVIEYPEFLIIHRMYHGRDFEFISISADKPENKEKALKYLKKKNSSVTNYIFNKEDMYTLIEAIDPEWQGALPYTLLIEPGGKKVYSKQGTIDPLNLKRTIVEHPMMGRYY